MAITGVHVMLNSPKAEELRAQIRDVFGWSHVDDGDGWLIFALPPAELGVHPNETTHHEISLMCDDIAKTIEDLRGKGIEVTGEPQDLGFGIATTIVLAGGVEVMLYEPRHASPS